MKLKASITILGAVAAIAATGQIWAEGNRYELDRYYLSEISVSEAYLEVEHGKEHHHGKHKHRPKPMLIDVRTLREYASGHPEHAYNVPYPNIYTGGDQDPAVLYWAVYDIVNGDLDTPIMLLCRTGYRSVLAGNILANPDSNPATFGLAKFTNVRNIWEGFVGLNRYAFVGGLPDPTKLLDLNNDGAINSDVADVYTQTKDANPDKDGWRNFAALPWTIKIRLPLAYTRNPGLYSALNLTPVE